MIFHNNSLIILIYLCTYYIKKHTVPAGGLPYRKTQEESAYEPLSGSLRREIPENVFLYGSPPVGTK
jgi:Cdc6-like AAA superfamily ATPase